MGLVFHRLVQHDLDAVLGYYEAEGGPPLADRFFGELEAMLAEIEAHPTQFHPAANGLRRANLAGFPYHVLFRERTAGVRVLVLRHNRRHPSFGLQRR